jgi:hypothetical protein
MQAQSYREMSDAFREKFAGAGAYECVCAMADCYSALQARPDVPHTDPYVVKLWAEIDAIRDRQMEIRKNVQELNRMRAYP